MGHVFCIMQFVLWFVLLQILICLSLKELLKGLFDVSAQFYIHRDCSLKKRDFQPDFCNTKLFNIIIITLF